MGVNFSIIGDEMKIEGNIIGNQKLLVNGEVKGDIYSTDDVLIDGTVNGNIVASAVYIKEGHVNGNIVAKKIYCSDIANCIAGSCKGDILSYQMV